MSISFQQVNLNTTMALVGKRQFRLIENETNFTIEESEGNKLIRQQDFDNESKAEFAILGWINEYCKIED